MKTKFILHGGFDSKKTNEDNHAFYEEILKDAPNEAKILLVPFAKDADRIPLSTEKVRKEFQNAKGTKSVAVDIATEEDFINQIKSSDVVYFHGGVSLKLLDALKKYPELETALKGKIIAGESAGANVWCKFFYSTHVDSVFEGLGLLPYKVIPHYREEYASKLDDTDSNLEKLLLPEYQFKIIYKDLEE